MALQAVGTDKGVSELWAREIAAAAAKETVLAQTGVTNRDYEGDISRQGDTVHITGLEPVTVKAYDRVAGLGAPERLTINEKVLRITESDSFDFLVDAIEKAQLVDKSVVGKASTNAGLEMAAAQDEFLVNLFLANAATKLTASKAVSIAESTEFYSKVLIPGATALNKSRTPVVGRFAITDADGYAHLLLDDKRFVANGSEASDARLLNGQVGRAAGLTVLVSTSPKVAGKVLIGGPSAITFAEQVTLTSVREAEAHPGSTRVSGLNAYGALTVRPERLAVVEFMAA